MAVSDYWIQPPVTVRRDGSWRVQIHIGRPGSIDVGKAFEIRAVGNPDDELREGKILIGRQGYFETNIHEITTAAGLSTGAFYTHFANKEAFFAELIHRVGREVRRFISINLSPSLNRLERELRGLWLFIVFLSLDRHCYGIVREAEFVLPAAVRAYYGAFADGYREHDESGEMRDETTEIEFMLGIAHYLGIEVIFDQSPENARNIIAELGEFYRRGFGDRLG